MNIKRFLLLALFLFSISLFIPKTAQAFDLQEALTSGDSIVVKIQEGIEYFFAFKVENKVAVLEKHAEKRLTMAQGYAEKGNNEKVQNLMQNYLQIKERQNNLLGKTDNEKALGEVEERTIYQQKTMEEIKTKIDEDGKQNVIQVQERVVNQVAERIVKINGTKGQTEFFQKVEHIWAPGTGPGGEAGTSFMPGTSGTGNGGVVIKGGSMQFAPGTSGDETSGVVIEGGSGQFAPGTSAGGASGADIKTIEVKTGGGSDNGGGTTVEGGNPSNTSGGNTVEGGSQNADSGTSSDGSKTWIDP